MFNIRKIKLFCFFFILLTTNLWAQNDSMYLSVKEIKNSYSEYINKIVVYKNIVDELVAKFQSNKSSEMILKEFQELQKEKKIMPLPLFKDTCKHLSLIPVYIQKGMDPFYYEKYQLTYELLMCYNGIVNIHQWKETTALQLFLNNEYNVLVDRYNFIKRLENKRNLQRKYIKYLDNNKQVILENKYTDEQKVIQFQNFLFSN